MRPDADVPRPLPVEPLTTLANVVTLVRTVAAVAIGVVALSEESLTLVAIGYGVYWVGDIADGAAARWRNQETRQGGVFDVVADRACTSVLAAGFIVVRPESAVPLAVFLLQFMVLDCVLTLAFLHWPIVSPNYFHVVDRRVYRLNWSPPAKAANTGAVVVFLALGWIVVATVVALVVVAVKVWSLREVARLIEGKAGQVAAPEPAAVTEHAPVIDCAALVALALGVGILSALIPVVNAEVFLLAATATVSPWVGAGAVVGLAVGQVAGKVVLFAASRRSRCAVSHRRERRVARPARRPRLPRLKAWSDRSLAMLDRRGPAAGVLLASAAVGVPPLALTTVAAGARQTSASLFVACALTGRLARFGVLAAPVVLATV